MTLIDSSLPIIRSYQSQPNFAEMTLGWPPSKIVSCISDLQPRWPPQPNLIQHRTLWEIPIKILLSETICITGHKIGRGPPKNHSTKVWLLLAQWFLRRRIKCEMLTDGRRTKSDGNSSTEPISTKLCWNDPWVAPFQNCVLHFRPPTKMATTAELNST
jgi:hypothetical protein